MAPLLPLFAALLCLVLPFSHPYRIPLHHGWTFSADLSLSSPLPLNAFSLPSVSLFTPILSSHSFLSGKGFSLGFLSLFDSSTQAPTSIFLTTCLGTNKTDFAGKAFAIPVWKLNAQRPLKQVGKAGWVSLGVGGSVSEAEERMGIDLILRDGDSSELWRLQNVVAMEMLENGNWVLYNSDNLVAWQSFDHPSDALLQGQRVALSKTLVSNNGLFTMQMRPGGLVFSMKSEAPIAFNFWLAPINTSVMYYLAQHSYDLSPHPPINLTAFLDTYVCSSQSKGFFQPYATLNAQTLVVQGGCTSSEWPNYGNVLLNKTYDSDYVKLEDDGLIAGYTYLHQNGGNLLFSAQSGVSNCLAPNSCGAYGICSPYLVGMEHTCHCPTDGELSHVFNPINSADPSQGCARTKPLECSTHVHTTLVEIEKTTLLAIHLFYETTYKQYTYPLQECIAHCTSNCSCAGFFYHNSSSYCLPFSDTEGLSNVSFFNVNMPEFSTYVKVQSPIAPANVAASAAPLPPTKHSKHKTRPAVYATTTVTLVILFVCSMLLLLRRYRRLVGTKGTHNMKSDMEEEDIEGMLPMLPKRFLHAELHDVTRGFIKQVGSGASGCVYEGALPDGRKVAVKKLDEVSTRLKQFMAELAIIGSTSHHNVIQLYGFCSQKSSRLLVYEFAENGSLDQWLFGKHEERLLSWAARYAIALGTARGLAYLHSECPQPLIHFDVKPQNILLDRDFVPKLCDFGLSKLVARESSLVMTGVRGTPGYLAPEWLSHTVVSKKCDVYSYGMVLFELIGGRKNAIQAMIGSDVWHFPTWAALQCQEGNITELVDKRLNGSFDKEQLHVLVHLAFLCIQKDPNFRPSMGSVCKILEGVLPVCRDAPLISAIKTCSLDAQFPQHGCQSYGDSQFEELKVAPCIHPSDDLVLQ